MFTKSLERLLPCISAILITFSGPASAQTKSSTDQVQRAQNPRARTDAQQKADLEGAPVDSDELTRQTLGDLARQVSALTEELRRLRKQSDRNTGIMELLLNEERLSKLEDKIQDTQGQKAQLDQRELDLQRRMKNIQGELLYRGAVRRDEAEAAIRAELQRALDDVHSQQMVTRQRLSELEGQAERLRRRVEVLRSKLEPAENNTRDQ